MNVRHWITAAAAGLCMSLPAPALAQAAGPQGQCLADCDGDGELGFFDLVCFLNAFANNDPLADLDPPGGDGQFGFFDLTAYLTAFAVGCEPVIVSIEPAAGGPGDLICIELENLPAGFEADDACVMALGGIGFDPCEFIPGDAPGAGTLKVKVLPFIPGVQPGPIMVGIGDGVREPADPDLFPAPVPDDIWFWDGQDVQNPGMGPEDFTPIPPNPDPTEKFKGGFTLNFDAAELCVDIPNINWERCDEIFIQFRAWCQADGKFIDVTIPRVILCEEDVVDTKTVARVIADTIDAAFEQQNRPELMFRIDDLGAEGCRICFFYEDCRIDGPAWQFDNGFATICVTGPAPDCDEFCPPDVIDIIDVQPPNGTTGTEICIIIDGQLPQEIEAKDLCALHKGGVVLEPCGIEDLGDGTTKITVKAFTVGGDTQPGEIEIMIGDGDCVDVPGDDCVCPGEPVQHWIPLDGFPVIRGGNWTPDPDTNPDKVFSQSWVIENGQQKLFIPDDFGLMKCDVLEILIRLWCPNFTPDVNIPSVRICKDLDARQTANLICDVIRDAFTASGVVPPGLNLVCTVNQVAGGWQVCIGYDNCEVTGGVADTGLAWTRVTVCRDPNADCDADCACAGPVIGVIDDPIVAPGEVLCVPILNWPTDDQGLPLEDADVCAATMDGNLFTPCGLELLDLDNDGDLDGKLFLKAGPQPEGMDPAQLMIKFGQGEFVGLQQQVAGVRANGEAWIWQDDPEDGEDDPIMNDQDIVPEGDPAENTTFTADFGLPGTTCEGNIVLDIDAPAGGFVMGDVLQTFLRIYCLNPFVRAPDVTIPDVTVTAATLTELGAVNALCTYIIEAYTTAGFGAVIECFAIPDGKGGWALCIGYSDCVVDGPDWSDGNNPSVVTYVPAGSTP